MIEAPGQVRRENRQVWLPPRILGIGVTGHRPERLGAGDLDWLGTMVSRVLDDIARAAEASAPTRFRLTSALAEGADSIVADAALARGWTLDVVLPFHRDDYAEDFGEGDVRDTHLGRLDQAEAVFELPGDRTAEGGEDAAYERAGRIVLAQADILIAIWDGGPAQGRGGTAQIVAEAVLQGIPVIQIDPKGMAAPLLLWDGLQEIDLGQQTIETVARDGLDRLGDLLGAVLDPPAAKEEAAMLKRFVSAATGWRTAALAYPLLLAIMGVRRPRRTDFGFAPQPDPGHRSIPFCSSGDDFAARLEAMVVPRFARADAAAIRMAQLFRSGYVTNFALAALAVLLSMLGLALPAAFKPALIILEFVTIATILLVTQAGNRAHWHHLWLDNRALAERLRCLALSAQLGDLDLRGAGEQTAPWVAWYMRATGRQLGLPNVRADHAYLHCVRKELVGLIDGQIAYLAADARRMHHLDHRLHLTGTVLFALTALACLGMLLFKAAHDLVPALDAIQSPLGIAVTIVSAALPAIGAAIYGIRMQGDFAGISERSDTLRHNLDTIRHVIEADDPGFDTLLRRVRRVADLLAVDLTSWLRTYHARPLALPG